MAELTPIARKFVTHWGELGTRWGINRTMAQVHALLYLGEKPLNAEDICETLEFARSNVSTALKELQGWGIVRVVHLQGDRRDHFESMKDVFEMFRVIMAERKRREIDPTLKLLREAADEMGRTKGSADETTRERLQGMLDFFELANTWAAQVEKTPTPVLLRAVKMGEKVFKLLGLG
ncbi:MAG: MarR family transcriptional regulator [Verrucomicrobiaceae bacterium]|nr:MarR family transcriptional regulator [Verrucomicrobiaceae bacterium]